MKRLYLRQPRCGVPLGALLTIVVLVACAGCGDSGARSDGSSQDAIGKPPAVARPKLAPEGFPDLTLTPINTFEQRCAGCHGPEGLMFTPAFRERSAGELRTFVREMMTQNARLRPGRTEENAMVAFHRALQQELPFAVLTNAESFGLGLATSLRGEVTAGTTVLLRVGDEERTVDVVGSAFELHDLPETRFELVLQRGAASALLRYPDALWSDVP